MITWLFPPIESLNNKVKILESSSAPASFPFLTNDKDNLFLQISRNRTEEKNMSKFRHLAKDAIIENDPVISQI